VAVPVLRRRMPTRPRGFKLPGGVTIPALACAASIWLLAGITAAQAFAGVIGLGVGGLLYLVFGRRDR
jgi:hypothetical protein